MAVGCFSRFIGVIAKPDFCLAQGSRLITQLFSALADETNPDFGGGALGSLGGNSFASNLSTGLRNSTLHTIFARFNTWTNDPPVDGTDYVNSRGGNIITE